MKDAQGKVTYKLVKNGISKKICKLVKITSKGVITIKKWKKAKCGTYSVKVRINAKGNTKYKSKTLFSYMTNKSVSEYIRKRRLTLAAYELLKGQEKIIDLAVKYGYGSTDSFTRAFAKQRGILPTEVSEDTQLKVYPPISFYEAIKGASELNFRIANIDSVKLRGISREFTGTEADSFEQEDIMWSNQHDDVQNQVCKKVEGVWYGIWNNGIYSIAKKADGIDNPSLTSVTILSGKYAVFSTNFGGFAGDVLPKLREQMFDCWLPDSGYKQTDEYEVEVYYLFPKNEKHKRHYEIWVPIE